MSAPQNPEAPQPAEPPAQAAAPYKGLREVKKDRAREQREAAKKASANKVTPIDAAKKAAAKKAAAPAKKAPAKKAASTVNARSKTPAAQIRDAQHPWYVRDSYTAVPGQKLYEATGESGQIAVRSFGAVMTHAVSIAHTGRPGDRAKAIREGVIYHFFANEDAAKKAAEKFNVDGDRAVVVPARPYKGQK